MLKKIFLVLFLVFVSFNLCKAEEKWKDEKITHFIIYYKNAPQDFINKLRVRAEEYYSSIADNLGFRRFDFWLWDNRAQIYIYDNQQDYQKETGQPGWSSGCAITNKKIIKTFPYAKDFFDSILAHELGHIIFREFVGFDNPSIPLWLDEGVASYQEKEKRKVAYTVLKKIIKDGKFFSIEQLSKTKLSSLHDKEEVTLFYLESYSIVDFLIKEYGTDNFMLFCQGLRDKRNLEKAIFYAYPFRKINELDEAWQEYLNKRTAENIS